MFDSSYYRYSQVPPCTRRRMRRLPLAPCLKFLLIKSMMDVLLCNESFPTYGPPQELQEVYSDRHRMSHLRSPYCPSHHPEQTQCCCQKYLSSLTNIYPQIGQFTFVVVIHKDDGYNPLEDGCAPVVFSLIK